MDGDKVELNDVVWDLLLGTGVVSALNADKSFVVRFGTRTATYQPEGMMGGVKRLFWNDPVLFVPRKHDGRKWTLIKETVNFLENRL